MTIKTHPNDPAQFQAATRSLLPCTENSMRLLTSGDGKGALALRFETQAGPVCYLTTVDELSDALEKVAGSAAGAKALDRDEDEDRG